MRGVIAGVQLVDDGYDTADYSDTSSPFNATGIRVSIIDNISPTNTNDQVSKTYSSNTDFSHSIFVHDLGNDKAVDTLISVEKVIGTAKNDTVYLKAFNTNVLANTMSGTGGVKEIDLGNNASTGGDLISLWDLDEAAVVDLTLTDPTVQSAADSSKKVIVRNAEQVIGSQYNDNITLGNGTGALIVDGGDGDDTISAAGATSKVTLYGGDGSDTLTGGAGNDVLHSGGYLNESNTLSGGAGSDYIVANGWYDTAYGGDGDDYIIMNGSGTTVDGGAGNDYIERPGDVIFGAGSGNDTVVPWPGGGRVNLIRVRLENHG